jgi:predicted Zn-dependent protease
MQQPFFDLVDNLTGQLGGQEVLLAYFSGEQSDFVRFNKSLIRQAGSVTQSWLSLDLIAGRRHVAGSCTLTGEPEIDRRRGGDLLADLRSQLPSVPEDPYLLYSTTPTSSEQIRPNQLPDSGEIVDAVLAAGAGLDLVGILAAGGIVAGFANSLGQRNWFSTHSFHFDWSFYHAADKAVKTSFAGFAWDQSAFDRKVADAREQLAILARKPKTIQPGKYRVYLAPAALKEIMSSMCWGGFSLKAQRTKTTCLLKMVEEGRTLAPSVTIRENTAEGLAPNFLSGGFIRPPSVTMIQAGRLKEALASPRSAKEFGVQPNSNEYPESLDMSAGQIAPEAVLKELDTGVYVNRLWYLNFSDLPASRLTGMTRFATFWVEAGQVVAPLNVMRFDETIYNMLGENLVGLTSRQELLPSAETYRCRSTRSARLPGALIGDFAFTL